MNDRTKTAFPLVVFACAFCGTAPAVGGSAEPAWTFYKPSNTGIPGDYVHTIYLDEQDLPWIPGYIPFWEEGGMAHWNGDTWLTISNVDYPVIASPRFNDIISDADGIMWIASDHGLLRYDPDVGPESLVRYDQDNTPMPASQIGGLDIDPDGAIWLAIHDVNDVPSGGLARFDPVANTWDVWTTASGLPWGQEWPGWDWVDYVAVVPDPDGGFTVWFGSYEMWMATYKDGEFFWYGNDWPPDDPLTPMRLMSDDPVDELGNLWILTWAGLARRAPDGTMLVVGFPDGLDTEVSRVFAVSGGRAFLATYMSTTYLYDEGWSSLGNWGSGSHTYAFAEDSTGAYWTGGIGGAAKYEDGFWQRYRLTNTGMLGYFIDTITFDDAGTVYMNGNAGPGTGGYDMFDGERWTCVNDANYGFGPPWGLPGDNASALCVRANGKVVVAPGLLQGALEWDGSTYTYLIPQGYHVAFLVEDGLGRLWGSDDYGIAYFVDEEGNFRTFAQGSSPLPGGSIGALIADKFNPGYVFIASQSGVSNTNAVEWNIHTAAEIGVPDWAIRCVDQADDGTLWVGCDVGMVHYDPVTQESTMYTIQNTTLPSNEIDHVTIAPDGSIWMSTFDSWYPYPGGVTVFDGETWTTFTEENSPLPLEQVWDLESRAVPGGYEVWVGTAGEAIAVLGVSTAAPGDLDGDGAVGINDLLILLAAWGACPPPCPQCAADLDDDCMVGINDLLILLANWG
ncbi:MAG: hypothetical protein ACYS0G_03440 [Planctomycetota bacterium]|jgi:ligand-binding sensor domain-containing protein